MTPTHILIDHLITRTGDEELFTATLHGREVTVAALRDQLAPGVEYEGYLMSNDGTLTHMRADYIATPGLTPVRTIAGVSSTTGSRPQPGRGDLTDQAAAGLSGRDLVSPPTTHNDRRPHDY